MPEKSQTETKSKDKQKETPLKILEMQNDAIEICMEHVNKYLAKIYAYNRSLMYILRQDLK